MDNVCSKHMTGRIEDFLSLKALKRGSVSFSASNKGYIIGIRKIGNSLNEAIDISILLIDSSSAC